MTTPTAADLRARFDAAPELTVGLEEELLLLDPRTFEPVPRAAEIVERAAGDPRVKLEMPAAQLELVTAPHATVAEAVAELAAARRELLALCDGAVRPAAAALHPTAPMEAELNRHERYAAMEAEYGIIARRQLLGALQVHVAIGDADRALSVYNALRGHLPEIAALAAAAPFHAGRDTGLASARPTVAEQLPRQGMPPALADWDAFADELRWGAAAGGVPDASRWWWELRPHVRHGTLELRVPDVQPTPAQAEAVATFAHALVAWLCARHAAGEPLGAPETWRIEENRWSALRHGVEGEMADLATGRRRPTREVLTSRIDAVEPHATGSLDGARALVERNAAMQLRAVGIECAASWLADAFGG